MPHAFVHITPELAQRCATHVLLTPNERLAREYQRAYDLHQHDCGKTGWPTLRCMSLNRYLRACFVRSVDNSDSPTTLLSDHQLLSFALHHSPSRRVELARAFIGAWQDIHRYNINLDAVEMNTPRGQRFRIWFDAVKNALDANTLLPEHIGSYLVAQSYAPEHPLLLIDFDQFTHSERRYFDFAATRVPVHRYTPLTETFTSWEDPAPTAAPASPAFATLTGFDSLSNEVAAAASWARAIKLEQPDSTIGIVVPELAQNYHKVQRQCAAILDPALGSRSQTFDLAAGTSLREQPIWRQAELLLRSLAGEINAQICGLLGASKYLKLDAFTPLSESWPGQLPAHTSMASLAPWLADTPLLALLAPTSTRETFRFWLDHFANLLEAAGWPNLTDLQSVQYQAYQSILEAFDTYSNDASGISMNFTQALELLNGALSHGVFAPQRPHSDIVVLGMLETTGLRFSHLWVCGLDENGFPARSKANPFLPRALAARHGVPRSTQTDELAFAQQFLLRWQASTTQLCLSFTHTSDDNPQQPSPLLNAVIGLDDVKVGFPHIHPYFVQQNPGLETFVDSHGTALSQNQFSGGTGLLRDQTQCPFRAYAIHRLGLKQPTDTFDFPNALVRGNLLHDTLFELVRQHSDQALLNALTRTDVHHYCRQTLDKFPLKFPAQFVQHEVERLTTLIIEWLVLEGQREAFSVVQLEESFTLDLEQMTFRIRIDRIDQVNNHLIVIDYKTGAVSLAGLTKTPTQDPQLAAYSLIDDRIAGVYYGEVRSPPRLIGVAEDTAKIHGSTLTAIPLPWTQQRHQWRVELQSLARDFADGVAHVDPQPGACTYCHLHNLCRIDELRHES